MLTSSIETYAATGDLSSPDIDLKVMLRRNVVPAFLSDVGYPSWRRKPATFNCVASTQSYDLPDDFWQMQVVNIVLGTDDPSDVPYIGDDPQKVLLAEAATTLGKPGAYYLTRRTTTYLFKKLKFDVPPDAAYVCRYSYYSGIEFTDDTTAVELDKYIPAQFQWALVEGLKREIMFIRFGIGDSRYQASDNAYQAWVTRAAGSPELARRNTVHYSR